MSDLDDLMTVAPIFFLMGIVLITGYLAPYVMGKFDDWDQKTQVKKTTYLQNLQIHDFIIWGISINFLTSI